MASFLRKNSSQTVLSSFGMSNDDPPSRIITNSRELCLAIVATETLQDGDLRVENLCHALAEDMMAPVSLEGDISSVFAVGAHDTRATDDELRAPIKRLHQNQDHCDKSDHLRALPNSGATDRALELARSFKRLVCEENPRTKQLGRRKFQISLCDRSILSRSTSRSVWLGAGCTS